MATLNDRPFSAFNFQIEIRVGGEPDPLVSAAFAECDGLEVTMDVKTIRAGGENARQVRLTGPLSFGNVTLKRGMTTASFALWSWVAGYGRVGTQRKRADVRVVVLAADGTTVQGTFVLSRAVPVKLKAPALNAKDGVVAVEELQLAYESLDVEPGASA